METKNTIRAVLALSIALAASFPVPAADLPDPAEDSGPVSPPIIYGTGSGGITMDTPYDRAVQVLGEPVEKLPQYSAEKYANGMTVVWDDDKTPYSIIVERGYAGTLAMPRPYGEAGIGTPLARHFPKEDPYGREFLRALYRHFEGGAPGYDCLRSGGCALRVTPDRYIVFRLPEMNLLIKGDSARTLETVVHMPRRDGLIGEDI